MGDVMRRDVQNHATEAEPFRSSGAQKFVFGLRMIDSISMRMNELGKKRTMNFPLRTPST
jgi:hypothetical protein